MPETKLVQMLLARGMTVTAAESCTGGRIASAITAVAGSSGVFPGSFVTYCDEAKHRMLGVSEELLQTCGAVSEPVAKAMARGAAEKLGTDLALSATGLAGRGGAGDIPCGTVYLGLYVRGGTRCEHHLFRGDRREVQRQATERALEMAIEALE